MIDNEGTKSKPGCRDVSNTTRRTSSAGLQRTSQRPPSGRAGRGAGFFVGLVAMAGLFGVGILWMTLGDGAREGVSTGDPRDELRAPSTPDGSQELAANTGREAPESPPLSGDAPRLELSLGAGDAPVTDTKDRFRGMGKIRGHVETSGDEPFPDVWRLSLTPSTTLIGSEVAVERVIDFTDGRRDFTVSDLPLGGYDVRAEAAGMNGLAQPVLLEKRSSSVFINLLMVEAGFIEGKIKDADGLPADGVVVTLIEMPSHASRETLTDALGEYRFEDVLDGAYQLMIGRFENPILKERRTLRMAAPGMTIPDIELPPLATLELTVIDPTEDRLLSNVTVRGSGSNGGVFEGQTDGYGVFLARYLPPGRWRLRLELEGYEGRRDALELEAGELRRISLGITYE